MSKKNTNKKSKAPLLIVFLGIILTAAATFGILFFLSNKEDADLSTPAANDYPEQIYSKLTGEVISNSLLNSSPTYCIQIPNGSTDGARPQVGLTQAGIIFEAIAETGITRFAAIFQNPTSSAIGPIRSLRPYYLDWDTPFDCTVVHAGGSDEALSAIAIGGQRDLDENYNYMWREEDSSRLWNNLFTSPSNLAKFNTDRGYASSNPQAFPRLTPSETQTILSDLNACLEDLTCINEATLATTVRINFSNYSVYNTIYSYNPATNTYLRSYQTGDAHLIYECPADLDQPQTKTDCGDLVQVNPSAIAAMLVQENTMSDGYHENIATIDSGVAYIFQNGTVIEGAWSKSSQSAQIEFRDTEDNLISFAPGQLWIAAVPQFGSVSWE